ncbi:MAG TPA: MATE family efflux transporter [Oscillospiraceae bacterium]|nr:MATE family efflux transporter [Oscillospiraceae bacterium]
MTENIQIEQTNKTEQLNFYKTLFKLAIPIIIQNLITSSINMVDTIMIGKIGESEIAAVGIANQYFFLFNLLIIGFTSGAGVFISQYWGQKNEEYIQKTLGLSLISSIISSILFTIIALLIPQTIIKLFNRDPYVIELGVRYLKITCISYIFTGISLTYGVSSRCIEDTIPPMLVSIIALITNAVLNYIFIFGHLGFPAMGVRGAAIATLIARIVEAVVLVFYIYAKKGVLAASWKQITDISKSFIQKAARTIIPVVINDIFWALAMIIYAIAYGYLGTQAMAAVQITTTVQNVFMVFTFGIAHSAAVMIGNQVGAGNIETGRLYSKRFLKLSVISGILTGIMLALGTPTILSFFNISKEVHNSALRILYIISATMFIKLTSAVIIVGILRGGGDTGYALKIETLTMWGIGVPLVFLGSFILKLPIEIVVLMLVLEEITKTTFSIKRLRTGNWIRQVTN